MKLFYKKYEKLNDVPMLVLDWAKYIGGNSVTINEVNELCVEYLEWISTLDDKEQLSPTIDQ